MVFKLAWRNACRSAGDYFVYVMTVIILAALLCFSHCVAALGQRQAGFQTAALPLLIVSILVLLVGVLNQFIVAQRAQELAVYLLMGMEKRRLIQLLLLELGWIGAFCCLLGIWLGCGAGWILLFSLPEGAIFANMLPLFGQSALQTAVWFLLAQLLSAYPVYRKLSRLQICQLFAEQRRNSPLNPDQRKRWQTIFLVSLAVYVFLLILLVRGNEEIMMFSIAFIAIPLLLSVAAFYKFVYAAGSGLRRTCPSALLENDRLLKIAEFSGGAKSGALLNTVFCVWLIFAFTAFCFGTLLFAEGLVVGDPQTQRWMGFLQINIGLIFLVLYFSMLSLTQLLQLRRQRRALMILHALGKSEKALNRWLDYQVIEGLSLPMGMGIVSLGLAAPFVNFKLNAMLLPAMPDVLFQIGGVFVLCFGILYCIYFFAAAAFNRRFLRRLLAPRTG